MIKVLATQGTVKPVLDFDCPLGAYLIQIGLYSHTNLTTHLYIVVQNLYSLSPNCCMFLSFLAFSKQLRSDGNFEA